MQIKEEQQEAIKPPSHPGEWSLKQIQDVISRPLPDSMLKSRSQGGKEITYIAWFSVNMILDKYAPGWSWDISKLVEVGEENVMHTCIERLIGFRHVSKKKELSNG